MSALKTLQTRTAGKYFIDQNGCWVWTRALTIDGYATYSRLADGVHYPCRAARLFYETYVGEIPTGLQLDHLCRNRKCVNPDHLEPVTAAINSRRASFTKLNQKQVDAIRGRYVRGRVRQQALADEFGIDRSTISLIVNGKIWA